MEVTTAPSLLDRCEACVLDAVPALDCVVVPQSCGRGLGCVLRLDPARPAAVSPVTLHSRLNRALRARGLPPIRATHVAVPTDPCWIGPPSERRRATRRRLGHGPAAAFVNGFVTFSHNDSPIPSETGRSTPGPLIHHT